MSRKPYKFYVSPFTDRYSSPDMRYIWSEEYKYERWRYLWSILASGQKQLGIDISDEQIQEMNDNISSIDMDRVSEIEKEMKHDVMAHITAFGEVAPSAKPFIHLGATSQFVVDNADSLAMKDSLLLIINKTVSVIERLSESAEAYASVPTVGLTHLQPAQPVTVGKRIMMWVQELVIALEDIGFKLDNMRVRGISGATGSKLSFLELFGGDEDKVYELDRLICTGMGFSADKSLTITGQTYPRILDSSIMSALCLLASACNKICGDIRILSGRGEISEGFNEGSQKGSSAMPYKRNPIRSEKVCSLSRHMMSLAQTFYHTSANQWMERSLDDSAGRRIAMPEAFLVMDEVLETMIRISGDMVPDLETIKNNYSKESYKFLSENLIIAFTTENGCDRQDAHEYVQYIMGMVENHDGNRIEEIKRLLRKPSKSAKENNKKVVGNIDIDSVIDGCLDMTGMCERDVTSYKQNVVDTLMKHYKQREVE